MFDFAQKTVLGLAAAVAMGTAMPAAAATLNGDGWSGNPACNATGSAGNTAAQIDVLDGAYFSAAFANGEAAGNLCFNFNNSSAVDAVVTLAVATVNQFENIWGFLGGVQLFSEQFGPAPIWTVAEGVNATQAFSFLIAANDTVFFDWSYGQAYASGKALPQINFTVDASPVPLPAGGLLLIGALGGLAALRRRKTV